MIKIEIINKSGLAAGELNKKQIAALANKTIGKLIDDKSVLTIEIFIVPGEKIREINRQFRQTDKETDVLTFPLKYISSAKEKVLGTIFIAPEVAKQKDEELEELIKHGILHLLGFDHEKKPAEWEKILNKLIEVPTKASGKDEK